MKHTDTQNRIVELLNTIPDDPRIEELNELVYDRKNESTLLELPIILFFKAIRKGLMASQKYGFLIQRRIMKDLKLDKPKNKNSGDASKNGLSEEIKCSILTSTNNSINIRQIRSWQGCNYIVCAADVKNLNKPTIYFFRLTHSDMERELQCCSIVGNSHGTDESNQENLNVEKSITIPVDENNTDFQRWYKNYRTESPWEYQLI